MTEVSDPLDIWICMDARPRVGAPALFLDRDGTIIENQPYLADPDDVRLIPGARETIGAFRLAGYSVVIVTNQSGVARGLCTPEQYRAVEARVLEMLGPGAVDAVYACPFHPAGRGLFAREHPWRKPSPGMLLDARKRLQLNIDHSVMVGDSLSDIKAGAAAGARWLVHALTGHGTVERPAVIEFAEGLKQASGKSCVRYVANIGELTPSECNT